MRDLLEPEIARLRRTIDRPPARNEQWLVAEAAIREFLDRHQLLRSQGARAHYEDTRFGELVGRAYPDASADALCLIGEWMAVWAIFDDYLERAADRVSPDSIQAIADAAADVFRPGGSPLSSAANPLESALHDVWRRLAGRMSRGWQQRFARDIHGYLRGCQWEAANRRAGRVPSVEDYIVMRRRFGGMRPSMDLAELAAPHELPSSVRAAPRMLGMVDVTADLVLWVNDLFSARTEREENNHHNLVSVLACERHVAWDQAVETCLTWVDLRVLDLRHLADRWERRAARESRSADEVRAGREHIAAMWSWIAGNVEWSAGNVRYRTAGDREGSGQPNLLLETT